MDFDNISTNPEAMRAIASSVKAYGFCQCDIVNTYLRQMGSLQEDISLPSFQQCLEAIFQISSQLEELKTDCESFAVFLEERASYLESKN